MELRGGGSLELMQHLGRENKVWQRQLEVKGQEKSGGGIMGGRATTRSTYFGLTAGSVHELHEP